MTAYKQVIKPNPNVQCTPGWCLLYVQDGYGLRPSQIKLDRTAALAWADSKHKYAGEAHPSGVTVPLYFSVKDNPEDHVALGMPDGSIYSSSSPTSNTPVHHASMAAMQQYWGNGTMLTYLGWTEDLEGVTIVQPATSTVTKGDDEMITENMVAVLFRFRLGRAATKSDMQWYAAHYTPDQADARIMASAEYKKRIADAKAGRLNLTNFLPVDMRNVTPAITQAQLTAADDKIATLTNAVGATAVELKPGLYEFKG